MAQQTQQPLLRGHPLGDPRAVRPPRSVKGSKNKDQSFPGSVRGNAAAKQEPGSTRAASRHHTRAHAGQDTPCSPGSPSVSPGTAAARSHTGRGTPPARRDGGSGGCPPSLPQRPPAAGRACPPPNPPPSPLPHHRPPSPCCAGGSAPAAAPAAAFPPPALPRAPLRGPPRSS